MSGSRPTPQVAVGVTASRLDSPVVVVPGVAPASAGNASDRAAERLRQKEAGISNGSGNRGEEPPLKVEAASQQVEQQTIPTAGQGKARADAISRMDPSSLQGGQLPLIDGLEIAGKTAEAHERMGAEDRNASWAPYMEQQIQTYLGTNAVISQQFSVPVMTCRATMCEMQVVGYGPGSFQVFMSEAGPMLGEPWATEFGGNMIVNTMPLAPDVQGIIVILTRESAPRSVKPASAKS